MTRTFLFFLVLAFAGQLAQAQKNGGRRLFIGPADRTGRPADQSRGSAPANDDCASAQAITITPDCDALISGTTIDATQDGIEPFCDEGTGPYLDVWYSFNSGAETEVWITLTPVTAGMDYGVTLIEGCGGAEVLCSVLPAAAQYAPVSTNTDYVVRVYSNANYGPTGEFMLCVSTDVVIPPPPPNDLCTAVVPQTVTIGTTTTYTGTNAGALNNDGLGSNMAWEAFTLNTCADVKIDFCGTAPAYGNFWLQLFDGCPPINPTYVGSYDNTACGDQNFTMCYANVAAGTYYVPIMQNIYANGPYTLHVNATACGTDQASNDDCPGAIPITAHATCTPETFTAACATESLPAVTCGTFTGNAADDVWYSFTATATDMTVGGAPNGNMDIVMELFSGTCGALTSIACGDVAGEGGADDMIATGLTIGSTYYFRVYDYRLNYAFAEPGYDLCVVEGLGSGVGVEEAHSAASEALFPNPSEGDFTLRVTPNERADISIVDATGRTVLRRRLIADGGGNIRINEGHSLIPGPYVVNLITATGTIAHRCMIH